MELNLADPGAAIAADAIIVVTGLTRVDLAIPAIGTRIHV
jgi:hypothetical protein